MILSALFDSIHPIRCRVHGVRGISDCQSAIEALIQCLIIHRFPPCPYVPLTGRCSFPSSETVRPILHGPPCCATDLCSSIPARKVSSDSLLSSVPGKAQISPPCDTFRLSQSSSRELPTDHNTVRIDCFLVGVPHLDLTGKLWVLTEPTHHEITAEFLSVAADRAVRGHGRLSTRLGQYTRSKKSNDSCAHICCTGAELYVNIAWSIEFEIDLPQGMVMMDYGQPLPSNLAHRLR